ncbi:MAG: DNA N-6-adenine-methyltransferase [Acidithiobacillus sp.]
MSSKPPKKPGRPRIHATDQDRWRAAQHARRKRLRSRNPQAALFSSKSAEWYTPPQIIQEVLTALGRDQFDLDPASPRRDGPIPAKVRFTQAEDGLIQPWFGVVWLNPPYGRNLSQWIQKTIHEVQAGHVLQVILLVPVRSDTQWWWALREAGGQIEHLRGRVRFLRADGTVGTASPFPSALIRLVSAFPTNIAPDCID